MKAILEFNLDESDEREAHLRAVKSTSLAIALWEMDQYLRGEIKHAPDSMPHEVFNKLQDVRGRFYDIMSDNNIHLDELMS